MLSVVEDVGRASFDYLWCRPPTQCPPSSLVVDGIVSRKSLSYSKLRQEPLNLTILKLDSSSFRIEVRNGATVGELKVAVEDHFSIHHLPDMRHGKVSWPHVWGQFCFSYNGQKLLLEKKFLRDFGIKDGDELCFVRHVSSGSTLIKQRLRKQASVSRHAKIRTRRIKAKDTTTRDRDILNPEVGMVDKVDADDDHISSEENEPDVSTTTYRRSKTEAGKGEDGHRSGFLSSICSGSLCHKLRKILRMYAKKPGYGHTWRK